jgi:hypothetical protein
MMAARIEPLSASILATMYFGDVVFAVSGPHVPEGRGSN